MFPRYQRCTTVASRGDVTRVRKTIGPGAAGCPTGSQRQLRPLAEKARHSWAPATMTPPAAGGVRVATLRSSRRGAGAGGRACSTAPGWWRQAADAAGTGFGAGAGASRVDHGRNIRSTAAPRTTAPVATHAEWGSRSTRSGSGRPRRSRNRRGRHRFLRWRDHGGRVDRQTAGAAEVFEVLPACHDHRIVGRKRSRRDGRRPAIERLGLAPTVRFFRRRPRGCSGYWRDPGGAGRALLPECARRFSATHRQTQGRQPQRRVPPARESDEPPAVQPSRLRASHCDSGAIRPSR